jgi:Ca-dependent carbohydrate-binding module xylan-binding
MAQTQAQLDTLAAQITTIVNTEIPGGELFSGVAYPITFDVGDVNVENFGSLTDKDGNTWTLTPGAQWWYGGVAENGTQLWTGYNIAMRLVNGDAWVEEAKFGGWWNLTAGQEGNDIGSRPGEGGDPGQSTSVTGPSGTGNGAIVIVPGSGSFKDAAGNVYTLDAAGNADENGKPVPNGSGTGTMELANGLVYGQDATSKSWYTWNGTGWATSGAPPAVTGGGTNPSGVVTGTGSDSLVLSISEDAYQGDAQFTVSVDGKQLGGTFATTAIHGAGQEQTFTFNSDWAPGQHTVAVDFLNDAYGGTAATDRNLYVGSETYDGVNGGKSLTLDSAGTQSFAVTDTTALPAPPLPTFPTATDGFVTPGAGSFNAAGNAYSIDGSGNAVQNGAAIPGGGGTSAMAAVGSSVYGQDSASGQWYSLNGTNWTATAPMLIDATSTGSINEALPRSGTVTENGDTFVMSSGNVIRATLSTGNDNIGFIAASKVTLTGGSGNAQVLLAGGTNTVTAGSGSLDATAGGGADAYVFHSGGGLLTVEDFSLAKGDTLTIDKSLQGSMVAGSDGHGGTALVFASNSAVDLKGVSAAPTIHWN